MTNIKCPTCGTEIQLDESQYESIAKQVRDVEFENEVKKISTHFESEKKIAVENARLQSENLYQAKLNEKDSSIKELKFKLEDANNKLSEKNSDIQNAVLKATNEIREKLSDKELQIVSLNAELKNKSNEKELAIKSVKENYENQLKAKDSEIAYHKDLKARLSTKMLGETLEQHCQIAFNQLRAAAFQTAYFEKDNDSSSGSKGDYIFRDFIDDKKQTEYVSIMFEMKNQADTTATKKKNEHFFAELDKDRREKKCEYAVLVSLLEDDNDYYNQGIVDVSYESGFEKMYVIRPQFFIPIITLIRNEARRSLETKRELEIAKNKSIDVTNFENAVKDVIDTIGNDYRLAHEKYSAALNYLDNMSSMIQKIKDALTKSENHLRLAEDKTQKLSIKKLTYKNPTMQAMFENLN